MFVFCLCGAAIAAESADVSPAPSINWATVIVSIMAATSFGTRILRWARDNATLLRIIADVLEQASAGESEATSIVARRLKDNIDHKTKSLGVHDVAEKVAAKAEKRNDTNGGATTARRQASKLGRFVSGVKKWLPIIGAFA